MSDLVSELMADRQQMKAASQRLEEAGMALATAEAEYQRVKHVRTLQMKAKGHSATMIQLLVKGDEKVNQKMFERDCAQVLYDSAREALNVYKLDARLLEAQIDREYRG